MKVILLEDVKNLGKKGDIVEASDSYARNVLLKKKIAVEANGRTMNDLEVTIPVKVGEGGKLFGSVSSKEIAEAVKDQLGIEVDRKKIQLGSPIRSTGEVMVPIRLHTAVTAQLRTVIESL